jgi:hypothetical protein
MMFIRRCFGILYKGSKKSLIRMSLICKLKSERSADMKKLLYNFSGINKISDLPSGTMQVAQMKRPYIASLWKKAYPI